MKLFLISTLILSLLAELSFASVLAIDYGSDWTKASLMKPGVPFDVLLNKDSKRKIQSSVGWKKGDRLFGTDAFNLASRFPTDSFNSLKFLQGVPYDSETVSFYKTISTADVVESSRKTVALRQSDGTEWSVEELVAMEFAYIKELAEAAAGEKVYDVIVTVPPFYSQFERDAVADAIEIAGLRTLALINDGTAVAVNYAMTRTFPTPEIHIIYDAGASATRATVVSFSTDLTDSKSKTASTTSLSVLGVGYDRTTSGSELDRRLREILIQDFSAKHKKDIRSDKRGLAKLWKEAGRVKTILSANTEAISTIESLAFDIDFKTKIKRSEFEEACADLQSRFARPIADALANAGLTLDNITSVILTGGSSRTPMVQTAVKAAVGEDKIALNVNADEAAVLGAALHGASISKQFKTKDIKVSDITVHDVRMSYIAPSPSSATTTRTIDTIVFGAGSKVGSKKTLTFKRQKDFNLWWDYPNIVAAGFPQEFLESEFMGVAEAYENLTAQGAAGPSIKATVTLSDSGFVSVPEAIMYDEVKEETIAGKLKDIFTGGSSGNSGSDASSGEGEVSKSEPLADDATQKPLTISKILSQNLVVSAKFPTIGPMTVAEKRAARDRLKAVDWEESSKQRKEEARNNLEGYLYRVRDLLDDDATDTPFKKCSQASEREALRRKLEELFSWLYEKGDVADTTQLLEKRNSIEILEQPVVHRYKEIEAFPQALNNSQMWNWHARLFLEDARANLTTEEAAGLPSKWTKTELDGLEKALKEHERWLNEWVEKQKSVKMNEDPVISTTEMRARAKTLETHLQRLYKRKAPKATKKASSESSAVPPTATAEAEPEPAAGEPGPSPEPSTAQQGNPPDVHDEL